MSAEVAVDGEVDEMVSLLRGLGERDALPLPEARRVELFGRQMVSIPLGCPWYTGTPLSTVEQLTVFLGSEEVPADRVSFALRDQVFSGWTLQSVHEVWWHMGELGALLIDTTGSSQYADIASVALRVELRLRSAMSYGLPGDVVDYTFQREIEVGS